MTQIKACVTWALSVFSESGTDSGYIRVTLPFMTVLPILDHEGCAYKWTAKVIQLLSILLPILTYCFLFTS